MSDEPFLPLAVSGASGRPWDVITLRGLTVDCIVGIYNRERVKAQPLRLDVALFLDARPAARSGKLGHTVHYGRLAGELRFLLEVCHFELLESAAETVCHYLLAPATADAPRARVDAVTVRLTKPEALGGVAVPALQVHRTATEMVYAGQDVAFGHVDTLHEGVGYGVYRLRVKPGRSVPPQGPRVVEQSELVLGAGLLLQGSSVARGTAFHWPQGLPRRYDNPTDTEQTVLCVARPRMVLSEGLEAGPVVEGLPVTPGHAYYPPEEASPPTSGSVG